MGIADKVPSNVRIAVVGLTLPIFVLYGLALAGCIATSPGITGLYLFLLKVDEITLRVGYFAACAVNDASSAGATSSGNETSDDGNVCVPTLGNDAQELGPKLFGGANEDAVPVLDLALTLQREILIPLILVAAVLMLLGAALFTLTKVSQMKLKDPNMWQGAMKKGKMFKPATLAMIWLSVLLSFGAAVGSSMGIGALNFIIPVLATNISVTGGKMIQALQYLAFVFGALFGLAATILLGDPLEKQEGEGAFGENQEFNPEDKELGYGEDGEQQYLPEEKPEDMSDEEWAQLQQQQQEQLAQQQAYAEGQEGDPEGYPPEGAEGYPPEGGQEYPPEAYDQQGDQEYPPEAYDQQGGQQPPYPQ